MISTAEIAMLAPESCVSALATAPTNRSDGAETSVAGLDDSGKCWTATAVTECSARLTRGIGSCDVSNRGGATAVGMEAIRDGAPGFDGGTGSGGAFKNAAGPGITTPASPAVCITGSGSGPCATDTEACAEAAVPAATPTASVEAMIGVVATGAGTGAGCSVTTWPADASSAAKPGIAASVVPGISTAAGAAAIVVNAGIMPHSPVRGGARRRHRPPPARG